ncbi:MAG: Lysophospholipase [Saliniramus fredricksonii]|uniref:Lysophospholipase n=1 Tax=Saliniramus fredricksonii TaxID=1653334 RepID=A0A0P7X4F2_9HYPH|nr:alpha/beta hydrolase [Saliniramus fredricksonii]KPQ09606.1 MAG: Lysophospholipase [Saliniramus fredricksonii]SCC80468.1 Lysophospholipase, alpha-beta hydrolase superfamily [Saliniramus fredricksonii]
MPEFITVGKGPQARKIAVEYRPGSGPCLVWLGGFMSDMRGSKAEAVADFAAAQGRACLRFDYSGHGESEGAFEDGTISRWCEEAIAAITTHAGEKPILIGSSMGGWIALLATRHLRVHDRPRAPSGLVLIAPAPDFTERLMWAAFDEATRSAIMSDGKAMIPSEYDEAGYPVTRGLIEDGRNNLIMDEPILTGCPVHILQGMQDDAVPWQHALAAMERMPADSVAMTLIKDGDHRLSRDEDIARLLQVLDGFTAGIGSP